MTKNFCLAVAVCGMSILPLLVQAKEIDDKMMRSLMPTAEGSIPALARDEEFDISKIKDNLVQCPSELNNQVTITAEDAAEWVVGGESRRSPLKGARLFIGPVNESTIQKYNELTAIPSMLKEKAKFEQTWALDEQMFQSGVLLVCDYAGNDHYLMHAVPHGAKQCQEVDVIDKNADTPPAVFCK